MGKFKFRLATVLKLREAARDERRAALAEAYRVDSLLQQRLQQMDEEFTLLKDRCRRAVSPGLVEIDQLVEAQRYEITLKAQQAQLVQQRESVAGEIERRREALAAANRDVRVLEKLRESQVWRHRQEENRQEIKQLDEVAQQRTAREAIL
jgi:flagellar protein FliJ